MRMLIFESLEMNNDSLPLEGRLVQALKIYARRLTVYLLVICANFVILGAVVLIQNLELGKLVQTIFNLNPLFWFLLTLLPLAVLQRLLHREIQAGFLITTRNPLLSIGLFSLLFLPGILLHELSHFLTAKLLGVRTGSFSILPRALPDGRLQLGYVGTERTNVVRDSVIAMAPLIAGSLFVAYAAIYRMQLLPLWDLLQAAQWDLFRAGLKGVLDLPDFWLWFYLIFTVSSTMMPSESDRQAWLPLSLWVVVLLGLAILASAGAWMTENLAPPLNSFLQALALTFGLSGMIHALLTLPILLLHRILTRLTGLDVR